MTSSLPSTAWRARIAALAVFIGACALRFIDVDFTNDDLLFFAVGRQIAAFGEWPVRDLFEEGDPLHNVASAVLQAWTGHALVGEALFDIAAFALAAALVTLLASRWLRSAALGAAAGMLTVVAWPRLYDYPKALIPALGLWLCDLYQRRPGRGPAVLLGLTIGLAFLLRHDFGVYAGLAVVGAIAVANWGQRSSLIAHLAACVGAAAALVVPYLVYVQVHVGLVEYIAAAQRFTQREVSRSDDRAPWFAFDWSRPIVETGSAAPVKVRWGAAVDTASRQQAEQRYSLTRGEVDEGRTWSYLLTDSTPSNVYALVRDPRVEDTANIDRSIARGETPAEPSRLRRLLEAHVGIFPGVLTRRNAVAWLYYAYELLPWGGVAMLIMSLRRRTAPTPVVTLVPSVVFCIVSAPLLLRGNLAENSRLADFTTPAVILAAALVPMVWTPTNRVTRRALRAVLVSVVSVTVVGIAAVGLLPRRVATVLTFVDDGRLGDEASRLWSGLTSVPPPIDWVARENGVRGAVEYLRACTDPSDRVLVFGFFPDILYFSGRGTAADRVVMLRGFGVDSAEERATVAALDRHAPALAIVETNSGVGSAGGRILDGLHPVTERYLDSRYERIATTDFGGSSGTAFDVWLPKGQRDGTVDAARCRSR